MTRCRQDISCCSMHPGRSADGRTSRRRGVGRGQRLACVVLRRQLAPAARVSTWSQRSRIRSSISSPAGESDFESGAGLGVGNIDDCVNETGAGARWQVPRIHAQRGSHHVRLGPDIGFGEDAIVVLDRDVLKVARHLEVLPCSWLRVGLDGRRFTTAHASWL